MGENSKVNKIIQNMKNPYVLDKIKLINALFRDWEQN